MRVALVVDNPKRDLNGNILLAYQLKKLGAEVFLVPMYYQFFDLIKIKPDVVVLNYIRKNNLELIKQYKNLGIKIVINDTEGGVISDDGLDSLDNWASILKELECKKYVNHYTFWGENVYKTFLENKVLPKERLSITGCPRYDLCNSTWRDFLSHEKDDFILINANFVCVNPFFSKDENEEKRVYLSIGWKKEYVERYFKDNKVTFQNFLSSTKKIIEGLPFQQFILRPHPFESPEPYIENFKGLDNVIIDRKGDVLNIIKNSKAVVHLNCGTAIEANLLEKPVLSLDFINTEIQIANASLPRKVSYRAKSENDAIRKLNDINEFKKSFSFEEFSRDLISPWFYKNDGKAAERIALIIKDVFNDDLNVHFDKQKMKMSFFQKLQYLYSSIFGTRLLAKLRASFSVSRMDKMFTPEEVLFKFEKIANIDKENIHVETKYSNDGYRKLESVHVS